MKDLSMRNWILAAAMVFLHQAALADQAEAEALEKAVEDTYEDVEEALEEATNATEAEEAATEEPEIRQPLPANVWALPENISDVSLSPSGKYYALIRKPTPPETGNPVIEVFNTEDLTLVLRQNSDPMEIQQFFWISDFALIFALRQRVRDDIEGFNQGVWEFRLRMVDVEDKKVRPLGGLDTSLASVLPHDPDHVLIRTFTGGENASRGQAFRPESFHRYNLKTGKMNLIVRSKIDKRGMRFDPEGNPLFASGYHRTRLSYIDYYRKPGTRRWKEINAQHRDVIDESFRVAGLDPLNPNHLIVISHNGNDTAGLWTFDPAAKKFVEPLFVHPKLDVIRTLTHSNSWKHPQVITGLVYAADTVKYEFFDEEEKAVYEQLREHIPNPGAISITSRSIDGSSIVVSNRGPADPGTYFLLHGGKMRIIGSLAPQIASDDLGPVEYITYTSRDGKTTIPAYVTHPKGEPPFPLVVLPHGGPWVGEVITYDPWSQMLANHGYMVIQPQYRGSSFYGLDFFLSSFEDGSQMGYAMQDDKDDGALYLVERGDVDPNRIAMAGWSYGGYAALVAAARTPQIYQCVISGAPVTDPVHQVNYYRNRFQGKLREFFGKAHELAFNPVREAEKVNIPVLLIHGEVDQRVPIAHANMYLAQLRKHDKPYEYLLLEGADHFYNTLNYDHREAFYTRLLGFLKDRCGPDGL